MFDTRKMLLQLRQEAIEAVEDYDDKELMNQSARYHFMAGVPFLDAKTARLIKESVDSPHMSAMCFYLVSNYYHHMTGIREALYYRDAIAYMQDTSDYDQSDECLGVIRGVREMPEFQKCSDLSSLPAAEDRQVRALLRVGYSLYSTLGAENEHLHDSCKFGVGSTFPLRITNQKLVSLVMENPTYDAHFCNLIDSRKNVDVDLFRQSLVTSAPLIDGTL
jgi:hypothetical protein